MEQEMGKKQSFKNPSLDPLSKSEGKVAKIMA